MQPSLAALCALAIFCGTVPAQSPAIPLLAGPQSLPTNEGLRHFRSLGEMALAPDGQHAVVRITEATADGGKSHIWLLDTQGGTPRQLTYSPENDKRGERGPEWMPDGQSVLFLAKRGEHTQLFRLPMGGGEAKPFDLKVMPPADASKQAGALPPPEPAAKKDTEPAKPEPVDVESYRIAPDGRQIAVVIHDPETAGEKKQKEAKADATAVDRDLHLDRLYLLEVATDKLTPVPLDGNVQGVSWSPDSTQMVAVSEEPNGATELGPSGSAWEIAVADLSHPRRLEALPKTIGPVVWSRDATQLFFLAQAKEDAPPGVLDLYAYSRSGQSVRDLSHDFQGTLDHDEPVPLPTGDVLEAAEEHLEVNLLRFGAGRPSDQRISLPFTVVSRFATNPAQNGWLIAGSRGGAVPGVVFVERWGEPGRVVKLPEMLPKDVASVTPKRITWRSDQFSIDGLLYLPAKAASGKVPLVVEVHGGPTGAYTDSFCPFCDFLVSQGWAVLRTNPRGSTGRGAAFAAANKNDLGGGDYRDILAGVDFVLKTEPVDGDRMALMGYSYGGEMAGFAETKTTRFKAIVSMAPVIDQHSEYGTEQGSWYDQWFYGKPWEHPDDAWRQSPLSGAGKAKTPFLLLQGEADTTDPLGQAQEMYRALRQMRVPVELVTYPRVDHGPLGQAIYGIPTGEPWHGYDARRRIVDFVQKSFASVVNGH